MVDVIGQTLGQYRIIEQIGQGGMATVYKAYQPSLDRYVAVKVLPPYFAHEPGFAMRFTREAKAIAKLNHPNILPIYDFGQEGELSYIVMKYVEAGTLKDIVGGPLPLDETADIIRQIAVALEHAHQNGILHRDVKPSNVLLDEGRWVLLTDFGLAKMVEGSAVLTASGVGVGTPAYMAPEQGQGGPVDARADIYSLGVVLYEMATGRVPFQAETPMAVVIKHITDPLPLPRTINAQLPEAVERVILRALAKDPGDRFASTAQMADALAAAVSAAVEPAPETVELSLAEPVPAPLPTPAPSPEKPTPAAEAPPTRKGFPWKIVGAVAVIIVALAAIFALSSLGGEEAEETPTVAAAVTATKEEESATRPAPTLTPQREPTATPEPSRFGEKLRDIEFEQVYLKAGFDRLGELEIDLPGGWEIGDDGSGNRVLIGKGRLPLLFPRGLDWTDYALEARVMLVEGEEGAIHIRQPRLRTGEGVRLSFPADRWELCFDPGDKCLPPYPAENLGVWHDVRIVVLENSLAAFLDGDLMFETEVESLRGTVGFGAHQDSVIFVDNLRISGPSLAAEGAARELYDDFDGGALDTARWEWLPAVEGHTAEVDDQGRLIITAENPGRDPQYGELKALTDRPVVEVVAELTVKQAEGERTDLVITLFAKGRRMAGVMGQAGSVMALEEEGGLRILLEGEGLPVTHRIHLVLTSEGQMHVTVDDRDVGTIPAPPVADGFAIAYRVGPGGSLFGHVDDVEVRYAEEKAGKTVTLWHFYGPDSLGAPLLERLLEDAQTADPGLTVRAEYVPFADIHDHYRQEVAAGGGPDLVLAANDQLGDMARDGVVLNLDPYLDGKLDGIADMGLEGMRVEGKLFGVPKSAKSMALFYNRSWLDAPPATTDELLQVVREGTPVTLWAGAYPLFGWSGAFGGQLMDGDGRCIADQGGWVEALEYLLALQEAGATFESDYSVAAEPFRAGETPLFVDGPWALDIYRHSHGENLGVAPLPAGPGGPANPLNRTDGFYINPNSESIPAAIDVALFLTSRESAQLWTDKAWDVPVRTDVNIPNPLLEAFVEISATGFQQPQNPAFAHYWEPFDDLFTNVLEGTVAPADGVARACAAMNAASESSTPPEPYRCQDELGCVEIGPGEPIHIAYLLDKSGTAEEIGLDSLRGVEIAVDYAGEILGHPITLTGEDSGCDKETGQAAVSPIANDTTVVAVVGTTCSTAATAAAPVISQAGLVMVSPSNTRIFMTEPSMHQPGYLRVAPNEKTQAVVMARLVWEGLGVKRAAVLHEDDLYSLGLQEYFVTTFEKLGGEITIQVQVSADDPEGLSSVLAAVAQTEPELIFCPLSAQTGGLVARQARETAGLEEVILVGGDRMFAAELLEVAGPAAEGVYLSSPDLSAVHEDYEAFAERYVERYGELPQTYGAPYSFDATMMILTAVEEVAVQDGERLIIGRQALRDALFGTRDFEGLTGNLTCTPYGDCADARVVVYQVVSAEPGSWEPGANPIQVWP